MDILRENGAFGTERKAQFPLRPDGTEDARVLLHCYSGSAEMAEQYVKLGASISIAGPVTYPNARRSREVVEAVDLLHLLAETDAPYLTPVPFRGKTNIPPYVEHTVRKMAEIKGLPYEEVARQTCQNGCRFFDIEL
jgi:TatD DNase family protein